jgi:hypothetical protein
MVQKINKIAIRPWSLSKLYLNNHQAPVVYMALQMLAEAEQRRTVTPTREKLVALTGISRLPTVTKALTTLVVAGWIDRVHKPIFSGGRQTATVLRITLRNERKSFDTKDTYVANEKRSSRSLRSERKPFVLSKEREAHTPPSRDVGAPQVLEERISRNSLPAQLNETGVPLRVERVQAKLRAQRACGGEILANG